jgi:hypothetical protein
VDNKHVYLQKSEQLGGYAMNHHYLSSISKATMNNKDVANYHSLRFSGIQRIRTECRASWYTKEQAMRQMKGYRVAFVVAHVRYLLLRRPKVCKG